MELYFEKGDITKNIQLKSPTTLKQILKQENISIESIILVKNDQVCLEETIVSNKDKIKLLSVVSGG